MAIDSPNYELCENEPIHLSGRVQSTGLLFVLDKSMYIVGISQNAENWLGIDINEKLRTEGHLLIKEHFPTIESELTQNLNILTQGGGLQRVLELSIRKTDFYLSTYKVGDFYYLEFEQKVGALTSLLDLSSFSQRIDQSSHYIWYTLCELISDVVNYDRVMIYQFMEDQSGLVIAEKVREGMESYMDLRYPEFDIPKQARALYLKNLVRLTSDVNCQTFPIVTDARSATEFDLTHTAIRAMSPIHMQYLRNMGALGSMSFSIVMHGKLWGLVACQNETPRPVDLAQRRLALFLTQYTISRYLTMQKEIDIQLHSKYREFELMLKEKLIIKNNISEVLESYLDQVQSICKADGIAIYEKGNVVTHGITPDKTEMLYLQEYLDNYSGDPLFYSHRFRLQHKDTYHSNSSFAGIARIDIDGSRDLSIYWFREETIYEEKWSGKPDKLMSYDESTNTYIPSPRTSFEVWRQLSKDKAVQWTESEIAFMRRVRKLIRESLLRKSNEIKSLNEKLILLNSSLDTYAYTISHDLKNPLSVIKLSGQLLQRQIDKLSVDFVQRSAANILDSVQLMEGLMSKVLEFSRAKLYDYDPHHVDIEMSIRQIVANSTESYGVDIENVEMGELLPLWGEKTLLYQLFLNLISNAVKYTSQSAAPKIQIYSEIENDYVKYVIRDNGIGIDKKEFDEIYNLFKRLSNSSGFEGSGVGLAIVKRIADRIDARILIDSEIGVGTTFTVLFPNAEKQQTG